MTKLLLKCFIASAFDKNDVDKIYEDVYAPILKNLSIRPLRVDKVEHNDDIDDKIISLIEESDFCIADLTFARPSVYYEAGYACGRNKPVIYTIRKDHFKVTLDDPNGFLRVHFDLRMKNIIPWSINDIAFPQKLEKRIKKIILPMLRKMEHVQSQNIEVNTFNKYSLLEKTDKLVNRAKNLCKSRGYSFTKPKPGSIVKNNSFSCLKDKNETSTYIFFYINPTITKKEMEYLNNDLLYYSDRGNNPNRNVHIIFNSFRTIPRTRIKELLTKFKELDHNTFYCLNNLYVALAPTKLYVHFIDSIKSESDFIVRLKNTLNSNTFI